MFAKYAQLPRTVYVLCLGTFINRAATFLVLFLTMYLTKHRGMSLEFAGLAMGLQGLCAMLAALMGGHLADQIGRRVVMLTGLVGSAVCVATFGYLESKPAILVAVALAALIGEMYRPAASAMVSDLVGTEQRAHAYSLMYVAINLGFGVGAWCGGVLAARSFKLLYWCDAATSLAYAFIIYFATRETRARLRRPAEAEDGGGADEAFALHPAETASLSEAARHIWHDRTFLTFCAANFLLAIVIVQTFTTMPLYLQKMGFNESQFGWIIGWNGWLIVLFQLALTSWLSRYNRATLIVVATVAAAVGFGLTGVAVSAWGFVGTVVIWTVGEMIHSPLMPAITTDLAPPAMRARYFGLINMSFSGANMIGAPIGAVVLAHFGGHVVWAGAFGLALASAGLYATLHGRIGRRPAQ